VVLPRVLLPLPLPLLLPLPLAEAVPGPDAQPEHAHVVAAQPPEIVRAADVLGAQGGLVVADVEPREHVAKRARLVGAAEQLQRQAAHHDRASAGHLPDDSDPALPVARRRSRSSRPRILFFFVPPSLGLYLMILIRHVDRGRPWQQH
jgi:hypothetical protein